MDNMWFLIPKELKLDIGIETKRTESQRSSQFREQLNNIFYKIKSLNKDYGKKLPLAPSVFMTGDLHPHVCQSLPLRILLNNAVAY